MFKIILNAIIYQTGTDCYKCASNQKFSLESLKASSSESISAMFATASPYAAPVNPTPLPYDPKPMTPDAAAGPNQCRFDPYQNNGG